jgi:acetyltransferase-like isoleucine patch superfamily enzyme
VAREPDPVASGSVPSADVYVHDSAFVERGAEIGDGTKVWHHAHVRAGSRIGAGCNLGKNVYVDAGAEIGDRVKIQNNVSVFHGVHIGDDVFLGPSATFTNDRVPRAFNADWQIVETWVERGASVGANATIVCGHRLGQYSMVAAGAVVTHDVDAHELVAGSPARRLGWVCRCGNVLTREHERPTDLRCNGCRDAEDAA